MKITYKHIATDEKLIIPLSSPYVFDYTSYPSSFVASYSKIAKWNKYGK